MADIYDNQKGNLESYINGFSIAEGQTGFVALINGNIIGLEALSLPEAFKQTWPKLIRSYALDAIDMRMDNNGKLSTDPNTLLPWLSTINPQNISFHKSPGLGNDIRWDETSTAGFVLDYNDEAVHTAVFVI